MNATTTLKATATLDMDRKNWDDVRIAVSGETPLLLKLSGQAAAVELNRVLMVAEFGGHKGPLSLNIDGHSYRLAQPVWEALAEVAGGWLEEYLPATRPEMFKPNNVVQLFAA